MKSVGWPGGSVAMTVYITNGKGFGTVGYVTSQKVQRSRAVEGALEKTGLEGTAVEDALDWVGLQARRVSQVEYRNTFSRAPGRAAREMRITANQSRATVVRRSFAISYHPSEDLEDEEVVADLDLFREKVGLEEHQAVIAVHRDRAHVHAHLVVNLVHPETHELWDSTYERLRSQTALREIEQERGRLSLEEARVDGKNDREDVPDWRLRKAKADRDVPFEEGDLQLAYESFRKVEQGEIQTWPELQRSLARRGLRVEKRGRGGVLADENGNEAPLSRVDRDRSFPKLEKRVEGEFQSLEKIQRHAITPSGKTASNKSNDRVAPDSEAAGHDGADPDEEAACYEKAWLELTHGLWQRPLARRLSALEDLAEEGTRAARLSSRDAQQGSTVTEKDARDLNQQDPDKQDLNPQDQEHASGKDSETVPTGRSTSSGTPAEQALSSPADELTTGKGSSSGKEPSSSGELSSDKEAGQDSWHDVRACAQKVIETIEFSYRDTYSEMPSAEHREARIAVLKAIRDHVGEDERAEEELEDTFAFFLLSGKEREVILDAARALQDRGKAARWATGTLLSRNQEGALSTAEGPVSGEVSIDPEERAARARSGGRLRARMARLSGTEADEVEAALEAKAAIAPTEEGREAAEAQRKAVRTRRSSGSPQALSEEQEEALAYVADIEDWESIWRDRPRSAEARLRRRLEDMDEGEIEDLKGALSESQRQVLEVQIQLLGADPEVRKEFGPKDVPSEWQWKIYQQARKIAKCGPPAFEMSELSGHPSSYERGRRARLVRMIREAKPHLKKEVEEELRKLSQLEGPVSDAVEQAWDASSRQMRRAAWAAGVDLSDRQERALRAADPDRLLDVNGDRVLAKVRRAELRATLTRMSGAEAEALKKVTEVWPRVQLSASRKEEVRQARDAILDEYPRAVGRPETLSKRQEKALAKVYSLEERALSQTEKDWLVGRREACESVSEGVQLEAVRLLDQLVPMGTDEAQELKTHLEEEPAKQQLLEGQIDEARKVWKREEAEAEARKTAETASEKIRRHLQRDRRAEAARALREAQATLKNLRNAAPEMPERLSEHRRLRRQIDRYEETAPGVPPSETTRQEEGEDKNALRDALKVRLQEHLEESLGEARYRELQRGLVEADIEDGRIERGAPEALEALSGPQREVADDLERAARLKDVPESTSERRASLRRAGQKMQGMDEGARSQIRRAVSWEAQKALEKAFEKAEGQARQSRREETGRQQSRF